MVRPLASVLGQPQADQFLLSPEVRHGWDMGLQVWLRKGVDAVTEHDELCRMKHMAVTIDIEDFGGCDCAIIELVRGVVNAERDRERNALLDALEDVVNQACSNPHDGKDPELDSMALSAYAHGMRTLAKYGWMEIISEYGRRVIAQRVEHEY